MNKEEDLYQDFLEQKCDEYLRHLIRIGTKLAKKGKLNEEKFSKTFLPQKDFVLKKIREQVKEPPKASDFDSKLIDQLRDICRNFEKEFYENDTVTKSTDESPRQTSSASMKTATDCDSPKVMKKPAQNAHGDSHFLSHELNYGELSKIFVQKSRVDVVRSTMEKPDFDDHLETIYVYRTRPC